MDAFIIVIFILISIGIFFIQNYNEDIKKKSPNLKVPRYVLVYTDQKGDFNKERIVVSEMIKSEKYDLRGKPDYIFYNKKKRDMLPIELKSGNIGKRNSPHKGDLMQLVAYFLIIEDVFGIRPKEGRIIYKDYMFVVKNKKSFRAELLKILEDMRMMISTGEAKANSSFATCRYCVCKDTVCDYCK